MKDLYLAIFDTLIARPFSQVARDEPEIYIAYCQRVAETVEIKMEEKE